ncbi:MAG: hypothetical protein PHW10_04270 [Candidatus Peribacteraceae bacterium]|nr:hypothetical protein [Candidatus Peribacteraceae bacterium]
MPETTPEAQFRELVRGIGNLTPQERLVGAFVSVRDIPYGRPNSPDPFDVLQRNRGTGKGKHILLKFLLTSLGYEVEEFWCKHDLTKMPIRPWPDALREFLDEPITGFHDFLKVKIGDRFVTVDATFDKALVSLGFPLLTWDGTTDMTLPVHAEETFPVEPPIDDHKRRLAASLPPAMQERRKLFLKAMKRWIEEERAHMQA